MLLSAPWGQPPYHPRNSVGTGLRASQSNGARGYFSSMANNPGYSTSHLPPSYYADKLRSVSSPYTAQPSQGILDARARSLASASRYEPSYESSPLQQQRTHATSSGFQPLYFQRQTETRYTGPPTQYHSESRRHHDATPLRFSGPTEAAMTGHKFFTAAEFTQKILDADITTFDLDFNIVLTSNPSLPRDQVQYILRVNDDRSNIAQALGLKTGDYVEQLWGVPLSLSKAVLDTREVKNILIDVLFNKKIEEINQNKTPLPRSLTTSPPMVFDAPKPPLKPVNFTFDAQTVVDRVKDSAKTSNPIKIMGVKLNVGEQVGTGFEGHSRYSVTVSHIESILTDGEGSRLNAFPSNFPELKPGSTFDSVGDLKLMVPDGEDPKTFIPNLIKEYFTAIREDKVETFKVEHPQMFVKQEASASVDPIALEQRPVTPGNRTASTGWYDRDSQWSPTVQRLMQRNRERDVVDCPDLSRKHLVGPTTTTSQAVPDVQKTSRFATTQPAEPPKLLLSPQRFTAADIYLQTDPRLRQVEQPQDRPTVVQGDSRSFWQAWLGRGDESREPSDYLPRPTSEYPPRETSERWRTVGSPKEQKQHDDLLKIRREGGAVRAKLEAESQARIARIERITKEADQLLASSKLYSTLASATANADMAPQSQPAGATTASRGSTQPPSLAASYDQHSHFGLWHSQAPTRAESSNASSRPSSPGVQDAQAFRDYVLKSGMTELNCYFEVTKVPNQPEHHEGYPVQIKFLEFGAFGGTELAKHFGITPQQTVTALGGRTFYVKPGDTRTPFEVVAPQIKAFIADIKIAGNQRQVSHQIDDAQAFKDFFQRSSMHTLNSFIEVSENKQLSRLSQGLVPVQIKFKAFGSEGGAELARHFGLQKDQVVTQLGGKQYYVKREEMGNAVKNVAAQIKADIAKFKEKTASTPSSASITPPLGLRTPTKQPASPQLSPILQSPPTPPRMNEQDAGYVNTPVQLQAKPESGSGVDSVRDTLAELPSRRKQNRRHRVPTNKLAPCLRC